MMTSSITVSLFFFFFLFSFFPFFLVVDVVAADVVAAAAAASPVERQEGVRPPEGFPGSQPDQDADGSLPRRLLDPDPRPVPGQTRQSFRQGILQHRCKLIHQDPGTDSKRKKSHGSHEMMNRNQLDFVSLLCPGTGQSHGLEDHIRDRPGGPVHPHLRHRDRRLLLYQKEEAHPDHLIHQSRLSQ